MTTMTKDQAPEDAIDLPDDAVIEDSAEEIPEPDFGDAADHDVTDAVDADEEDDDDDYIEVSAEAFVPVVNLANAIPAPIDTWLPFRIKYADPKGPEDNYYDADYPQIVASVVLETTAFGGRQYPYRLYLDQKLKPREGKKQNANAKVVTTTERIVRATGLLSQPGRIKWSNLHERLTEEVFMGQLYHAAPRDKEFQIPAVYGDHCALISPVNGHHFSDTAYSIVVKVEEEMMDDPEYAIYTDEEGVTTVLKPKYDEDKIAKAVQKAVDKFADELDDSSLDEEAKEEQLAAKAAFEDRRARGLLYYNASREDYSPAGAPFKDENGSPVAAMSNDGDAIFGTDDDVFTEVGYGQKHGTEIIDFKGAEFTITVKVPAPKNVTEQDPKEIIRSERLSPRTLAPVPDRMLTVREEPGVEAHYEVKWNYVGFLEIEDTPVQPGAIVECLDFDSTTGTPVLLEYGGDSMWHPYNPYKEEKDDQGRKIYTNGTWAWVQTATGDREWQWTPASAADES